MHDDDHERRILTIEHICQNTIPRIETYMKESIEQRVINAQNIGAILESVTNFKSYQKDCDDERKDHEIRLVDHAQKINDVKGFQNRSVKIAAGVGGLMAFLVEGGAKAVNKLLDSFQ